MLSTFLNGHVDAIQQSSAMKHGSGANNIYISPPPFWDDIYPFACILQILERNLLNWDDKKKHDAKSQERSALWFSWFFYFAVYRAINRISYQLFRDRFGFAAEFLPGQGCQKKNYV